MSTSDLFEGFEDIYKEDSDWTFEPLTFREFVESPEHMNHPGLTDRQYKCFESLVGTNPKEVFHNLKKTPHDKRRKKHIKVLMLGKGSGKDLASSLFQNYLFYLTLCMKSPTDYFDFPSIEEHLDMCNVAQNQTQSIKVFFSRFTTRVKNWRWAKKHFAVFDHGKRMNPECTDYKHTLNILDGSVSCSNAVHFHALHTSSQGFEGLNIIAWTMDEPSAFENYETYDKDGKKIVRSRADDILDVLRTSADSRNVEWLGIIISYPRSAQCFTMRKYKEAMEHQEGDMLAEKGTQWEYLPASKFSGRWVMWEGYRIPEEKLAEAKKDPASFKLKYLCEAEEHLSKYFQKKDYEPCFKANREFIGEFTDDIKITENGRKYLYKSLDYWKNVPDAEIVFAGDYSSVTDRTSIVLGHSEKVEDPIYAELDLDKKVIVDLILVWQPDPKNEILVSHTSIRECVKEIKYRLNLAYASLDQLESCLTLEEFNTEGINADKHNINDDDYRRFRSVVQAGLFECPVFPLLFDEFGNVQYFPKRHRVDHTSTGSKDVLDCCCQITRILYTKNIESTLKMQSISQEQVTEFDRELQQRQQADAEEGQIQNWAELLDMFKHF